ncbi:MAG TPA: hypothetical protein VGG76_01900, partial [Gemmatimonadaceae bacterium]
MVFRTHARLVQVSAIVLALAAIGCQGGTPPRVMRNGDDALFFGGSPNLRALDSVPGDAIMT